MEVQEAYLIRLVISFAIVMNQKVSRLVMCFYFILNLMLVMVKLFKRVALPN